MTSRGLTTTADRRRVTGVRIMRRADGSAEEIIDADLVVDAMGRSSRTPAWLVALGYDAPEEERVRADVGYAARRFLLSADVLDGDLGVLLGPTPAHPRGGALAKLEGDQWILTLFGLLGDHPPSDPDGYFPFARSLPRPDIIDALRGAEALDDPVVHRFPASVRHRYERLVRFPEGPLGTGDSLCSLNHIYGQGMSVAALEALALRAHLGGRARPQPRRFLRDVAAIVDAPWEMVAGGDLSFPGAEGRRTARLRMAGAYIPRLHAAAAHDPRLAAASLRVAGLVDPPEALLRPGIAARVLRHRLRPPPESAPSRRPAPAGPASS